MWLMFNLFVPNFFLSKSDLESLNTASLQRFYSLKNQKDTGKSPLNFANFFANVYREHGFWGESEDDI